MTNFVVTQGWLAEHRSDVRVVDVRDAWEFGGIGHIPGAVNVPFEAFRADDHAASDDPESTTNDAGMLPGELVFERLLEDAGLSREDHLVAYDDHHGVFAARFLVTALLYGHSEAQLSLLDGDFSAWQRSHETTSDAAEVTGSTYDIRRPSETPLIDSDGVSDAVADTGAVIVDTREQWEFEEGHIPGAVRLDWRRLVDDETRGLRDREELEQVLSNRGITPQRRVVLYCNTARRISHTYIVLRHLGYEDLAFYEGSLTQWKAMGRPIET